jgi:hypothetical protein
MRTAGSGKVALNQRYLDALDALGSRNPLKTAAWLLPMPANAAVLVAACLQIVLEAARSLDYVWGRGPPFAFLPWPG